MKSYYSTILLFILSLSTTYSQNTLIATLDSIATAGINDGIPGIQILVADSSKTLCFNYGFQDIEGTHPINDSTNWRYGSITKVFTTVMILQLETEGKLSIHDSVHDYIDLGKHQNKNITILHLLNHTSGLYNYTKTGKLQWNDPPQQCLDYSLKRKLDFSPGHQYKYCNTGYLLLGLIIEEVTALSYEENLKQRIFMPCNLTSMEYSVDNNVPKNTARGYIKRGKKYRDITAIDYTWANAAGAILGNLEDLQQFSACLFDGTLLDSNQLQKMIEPTILYRDLHTVEVEWYNHAVGLCLDLNLDENHHTIYVNHGGNAQGYNCNLHYNTRNGLTILIGMNLFPNGHYKPVFSTQNRLINAIHEYYKVNPL